MDDQQRLKLQEIITKNNVQDNTEKIRRLKHSDLIRKDVAKLRNVKRNMNTKDFKKLDKECLRHCSFLFRHYPNIYNKLLKDEINLQILYKFLDALKSIENGTRDQHEASYEIGMLLRKIYVEKKVDIHNDPKKPKKNKSRQVSKNISYDEFKKLQELKKEKN